MADYLKATELETLFRRLSQEEREKAEALIPVVCASLREEAKKVGKDLDAMIEEDGDLQTVARSVTADVVARCLMTPTSGAPMIQTAESALGYSFSGTYLNPGGGIFIKKSELSRLGLRRQRFGTVELYGSGN